MMSDAGKALRREARPEADIEKSASGRAGQSAGARARRCGNADRLTRAYAAHWQSKAALGLPCKARYPSPHATPALGARPSPTRTICSPGTTATGATCRGARGPARPPTLTASGCPRSCCSRRRSRPSSPIFARFLERFPTVEALAEAPAEAVMQAWAGLGYYSRARNLHACAKAVVEAHRRALSRTRRRSLRTLPGIGAYTAAAIAAIAFDQPAAAVDGNVERVIVAPFTVEEPLPKAKPRSSAPRRTLVPADRPGDFAQAMMDLGATICTPKRPACALCPWMRPCRGPRRGPAGDLPAQDAEDGAGSCAAARPSWSLRADDSGPAAHPPARGPARRHGRAADQRLGARLRPRAAPCSMRPLDARWQRLPGIVRHVFTHFPLELTVLFATRRAPRPRAGGHALDAARSARRGAGAEGDEKGLAHALPTPTPAGKAVKPPRP